MPTNLEINIVEDKKNKRVLPEDVYNVGISNIKDVERKKYMSEETEKVMLFTFTILNGEFSGEEINDKISPTIFIGKENLKPSKLYQLLCSVYKKQLDDEEIYGIRTEDINAMIGKKLRIAVKQYTDSKGNKRNKIDSFLPLK